MRIIIKKLRGGECTVEVTPETTIIDLKREIFRKLGVHVEEQKLLLMGRALTDCQTIESYPLLKYGSRINLIVKKPDSLQEAAIKYLKKQGYPDNQAAKVATDLVNLVSKKFQSYSWDDIERLACSCMGLEDINVDSCEMNGS